MVWGTSTKLNTAKHNGFTTQKKTLYNTGRTYVLNTRGNTKRLANTIRKCPRPTILKAHNEQGGTTGGFAQGDSLVQLDIERVHAAKNGSAIIYLSIKDGSGKMIPVYVGEAESLALDIELSRKQPVRPQTYDLFKKFIMNTHSQVSRVVINDLRNKIYYSKVVITCDTGEIMELDARPSDAINLAARFKAPIYVNKEVLQRAQIYLISTFESRDKHESQEQIETSVKELLLTYIDPTTELQARLAVAVAEERFQDAARMRDEIDTILSKDRRAAVCVAMESALNDKRYEEAAFLRNQFLLFDRKD